MNRRPGPAFKGRLTAFVDRHRVPWEIGMALLTVGYVALAILKDEMGWPIRGLWLAPFAAVFLLEFVTRVADSDNRVRYLREHWIDLITAIPLVGVLGTLRMLRVLRVFAAFRVLHSLERSGHVTRRDDLTFLAPASILLWASMAYALWIVERGANSHLRAYPDALYLVFLQVTTLGFGTGSMEPVTPLGKGLSGLLILMGIGFVGLLSGQLTSRFLRLESSEAKLDRIEFELRELKALLTTTGAITEPRPSPEREPELPLTSPRPEESSREVSRAG